MNLLLYIFLIMLSVSSCGSRSKISVAEEQGTTLTPKSKTPINYGYEVVNVFPHSQTSYTQGLLWHDGFLYEGTGGRGSSRLMKVNLACGEAAKTVNLPSKYFGEGVAILGDKIYQLTWTAGKAFVYDLSTLKEIETFDYNGEGWGITTDGKFLYMSDGSHNVTVRDPETFEVVRTFTVLRGRNRLRNINELEWIEGELWANVYLTDEIVRINPETGVVTGVVDLSGIQSHSDRTYNTDVLNGIAYDAKTKRIFVTGKNWNKLYEIVLKNK